MRDKILKNIWAPAVPVCPIGRLSANTPASAQSLPSAGIGYNQANCSKQARFT